MKTSRFELGMAAGVGACLFVLLFFAAVSVPEWRGLTREEVAAIPLRPTATPIGMALLGPYLLIFEIISVHLLVVLIGAAYLARARRKRSTIVE
jgi:NADH:ubiquinone oxidoreductase subunit 6 (subunit J)